jgi:SsrA-binding protein
MKIILKNKKLKANYEVIEKMEAGIALTGTEVKSLREGKVNFKDSYCKIKNGEVFLLDMHISPYNYGGYYNHDPERPRKLLLHKKEIFRLKSKISEKGYTLVPSMIYFNNKGKVKIELALCKGKNKADRRETLKRRDIEREIRSRLKHQI